MKLSTTPYDAGGKVETLAYFKCRWPEETLPEGEPLWMYYEVVTERDIVTRIVDLYPNGDAIRDSLELDEREGPDQRDPKHRSLVHGPFLETLPDDVETISGIEFCQIWDAATDNPSP